MEINVKDAIRAGAEALGHLGETFNVDRGKYFESIEDAFYYIFIEDIEPYDVAETLTKASKLTGKDMIGYRNAMEKMVLEHPYITKVSESGYVFYS